MTTSTSRGPFYGQRWRLLLSRGQVACVAALLLPTFIILSEYSTFGYFPTSAVLLEKSPTLNSTALAQLLAAKLENKSRDLFLQGKRLQPSNKNILFIETSCALDRKPPGGLRLTSKQVCSIYSAAQHNPSRKVVLLYTCPLSTNFYQESSDPVTTLFDLPNFSLAEVNLTDFCADTPLERFVVGPLRRSIFKIQHAADALRLLAVYFYGGTYMDLDIVSLRPLNDLGTNFIVAQDVHPARSVVASGVFNFDSNHEFMKECVMNVVEEYDPFKWSTIGPELVTKVLRDYCNLSVEAKLDALGTIPGCNITVWTSRTFYAITYWNWNEYYREGAWPAVEHNLRGAFGAHVWNHMGSPKVTIGGSQPYGVLAEQHCNAVYVRAGAYFRR